MSEAAPFVSSVPWEPVRPATLVILCSDGRWRPHVQDFVRNHLRLDAWADLVAVPGGVEPLTLLNMVPKDFNFLKRRLEALVEIHGTRRVVLIGHQDCAWYKARKLGPIHLDLTERQIRDLRRSAERLHAMFGGLQIEAWFARLDAPDDRRVVFDPVAV